VIFTSGSTGRPKGAMLEHRGLVNFCYYYRHFHEYRFGERCAEVVRPGFDASMSELAGFFFNGIAAFIPDNDAMANPARLVDFIVENKVTRMFTATPLGELLIERRPAAGVSMIELQMGGEALRKRWPRGIRSQSRTYGRLRERTSPPSTSSSSAPIRTSARSHRLSGRQHRSHHPHRDLNRCSPAGPASCSRRRCRAWIFEPPGSDG
jgi:non-ribosomal peptide synthetase component F